MSSYDAWLEAPYQQQAERDDAYYDWLETNDLEDTDDRYFEWIAAEETPDV